MYSLFFFFNDTATTEIYTLSLHDALPIWHEQARKRFLLHRHAQFLEGGHLGEGISARAPAWKADRKSTRLNSSHANISYAVFCLKKKKNTHTLVRCGPLTHLDIRTVNTAC